MSSTSNTKNRNSRTFTNFFDLTLFSVSAISISSHYLFQWMGLSYFLTNLPLLLAIVIGIFPLSIQIFNKLLRRELGADLLAWIAFIVAIIMTEYVAAGLIMLMLSGGHVLEQYALRKASQVLSELAKRIPSVAHLKSPNGVTDISITQVKIGDQIVIFPHETAPVDGQVMEGHGSMNESYLTGEPYQISKTVGSDVISGSINGETMLTIRATKPAEDSRYTRIMQVMKDAEQKKPHMRRLGDQIGAIFTPIVLIVAVTTWILSGDPIRFLSVLVIATPCPLIIAIPITIISAISMAAKHAIIIKDPLILERLPTCQTVIFDKTGTLTYGKPELTEVFTAPETSKTEVLQYAASLERYSKHPLSQAILDSARSSGLKLLDISEVSEKPGQGLTGIIEGKQFQISGRNYFLKTFSEISSILPPLSLGLECIMMRDGNYMATFRFRDMPRTETTPFVKHLFPFHRFKKIMLVSGDRETEVKEIARVLGITETFSSQSPEQKLKIVRDETSKAPTLFMGDGINDAPALASATAGIAFGQNSPISSEAAGAVILENSFFKVDQLLHLSLLTRRIALQSSAGGMLLSIVGMGFAAYGWIQPVTGAVLQEMIDILAISNALRLLWQTDLKIDLPEA